MTISVKTLFAGAALASALIAGSSASAAVIIKPFLTGPFSLNNPLGTIAAIKVLKANTYDFTFTLEAPLGNTNSTQLSAQLLAQASSIPKLIQYSLYEGTPGSGTFISQSTLDFSPTIAFTPVADDFYVELDYIAVNNEVVGGTLTSDVPEPASGAMMLVGFGALGVALRRRSAKVAAA